MNEKVTKLPSKSKVTFAVYTPGERMPTYVEATQFNIVEDHLLYLTNGGKVIAVFHQWEHFERMEELEGAA